MPKTSPVNHRVIAAAAGVSRATVSLSLRDDPSIREETRLKVRAVAQRLGYRSHPVVSTYMHYVSRRRALGRYHATLALIADRPFEPLPRSGNPVGLSIAQEFRQGIERRAGELGYGVETFVTGPAGMTAGRLRKVLRARGIAGLIFVESPDLFGTDDPLDWSDFSAVTYGYSLRRADISRACANHFVIVTRLLEILRDRGYARIGFVSNNRADRGGYLLAKSAYLGFQSVMPAKSPPPLSFDEWSDEVFAAWLKRHRPDVVVSHDATRMIEALRRTGRSVPFRVGVAGYRLTAAENDVSGFSQDYPEVGAATVDLLVEQIHRNERGPTVRPKLVLIEGTWHEGRTLRT